MITQDDFVLKLTAAVPESAHVVAEHMTYYDELLLHLLMFDLLRLTVSSFAEERTAVTDRLLTFIDRRLREGDDAVSNAVAVSFVEHFGVEPGESDELLYRWPPALRAELGR